MNRKEALAYLLRVADPLLRAAAEDRLSLTMPVGPDRENRALFTGFEGVARLILGIAPWLVCEPSDEEEAALQREYGELCRRAIHHQLDPKARDYAHFEGYGHKRSQQLVDLAFLIQGIYRGRAELLDKLDDGTKELLLDALTLCRSMTPHRNNWYLFSAFVEAGIYLLTGDYDHFRVEMILRQMGDWYAGDGFYKDGPMFAMDYYNSFVILPMLYELSEIFENDPCHSVSKEVYGKRLTRYAEIQERQIAPDGTYIVVGRSVAYRCGAFQALSLAAWKHMLPNSLSPAQVRCALSAVIGRTLSDRSFDKKGFLVIGVCGEQPDLGEPYISTGSLYLCSAAFLVLGLPETDALWQGEDLPWTQKRIWSGENLPRDQKLKD